ncbi:MAG TPA: protein kinase, partial [Rhodobacteraceae bacterium]|nr:protein kinase [Paracoccaceae bacterium]
NYKSAADENGEIPHWIDAALKKSLHPERKHRYETLSEFTADLRRPNKQFSTNKTTPLAERNPVAFWQGICAALVIVVIILLAM